jgi:7-cyano-7-deazaguanine synthase
LYWAIERFGRENTSAISFDYGQRHRIELECAKKVAEIAGVPCSVLPIDTFAALGGNALTDEAIGVQEAVDPATGLPNTFVPGRNLIFLTFAAAWAYGRGITEIVTGVGEADYSGYPDCRSQTILALQESIRLGMEHPVTIHTPLMQRDKRAIVELARELGALDAMAYTHTCYQGWQPPCGECPACRLRAKGFREAGVPDPLLERLSKA